MRLTLSSCESCRPRMAGLPSLALAAFACLMGVAPSASAATTTYDTNNTPYTGGTIAPGDTVLLNDGATVTGPIAANGTLQFNQTGLLTISDVISGTGTLSLTNTGTLNLDGAEFGSNVIFLDMTTSAAAGTLTIQSGTAILDVGRSGTGALIISGGGVFSSSGFLGQNAGGVGSATVSGGTWSMSNDLYVSGAGTGILNVTGGSVTNSLGVVGTNFGGVGVATITGGTWP